MESTLLRPGLHDLLAEVKTAIRQRNAERGKSGEPSPYLPLVADDKLFFLVASHASADRCKSAARTLRGVFADDVWSRIPNADRQTLLAYWDAEPWVVSASDWEPAPPHTPLILLTDTESPACERFGLALSFPLTLVDEPDRLADAIANILAWVFRLATRAHWQLYLATVEKPLAQWQKRQKAKVSYSARKKKVMSLEKKYLRKHDAEINEVLRRWGLPPKSANGESP